MDKIDIELFGKMNADAWVLLIVFLFLIFACVVGVISERRNLDRIRILEKAMNDCGCVEKGTDDEREPGQVE